MLTPINQPLPLELQERGYQILEIIRDLTFPQQLDLACRTVLAALLSFRPDHTATKEQCQAFKTMCTEVQVWLRGEIAEIRRQQPRAKKAIPRAKPRPKVGHA